jgi:inosine-uridine nucleoside N-ribohydrolase
MRLGEMLPTAGGLHQRHDAGKLLVDLVRFHPHEVVILTLGPLTNLVRAAEHWPDFWTGLRGVVSLAGALQEGDVTATAEFNVFADPESARMFLNAPATRTLVPLETGRRLMLTFEQYDRLNRDKYSRVGQFLERTIAFALRSHRQFLGKEALWLPEVVALAAAVQPRLFDSEMMAVDIELEGRLTRGMTVIDRRSTSQWKRNVAVATDVDTQGVLDYLSRVLGASASAGRPDT